MESDNAASKTHCSGRRCVVPATVAVPSSVHPTALPVNATVFEIEVLSALIDVPAFADRIEAHGDQRSEIRERGVLRWLLAFSGHSICSKAKRFAHGHWRLGEEKFVNKF